MQIYKPSDLIQYEYDCVNKIKHSDPPLIWKIGWTSRMDAAERLSEDYHNYKGYNEIPLNRDYDYVIRMSAWFPTVEKCEKIEDDFKSLFNFKNLWTKTQYNGITECRVFTNKEGERVVEMLKQVYPKSTYSFQKGYFKLYFAKFFPKASQEITQSTVTNLELFN